jgi:hypothetical protein
MPARTLSAFVCFLSVVCLAAAGDPFTGTWKLNLAKSTLPPPVPQSVVSYIRCDGQSISVREEIVDATGQHQTASARAVFDGKDYPVVGSPLVDAVAYQRIDSHTIKAISKKGGKALVSETVVISADGKTMTATYSGVGADGKLVIGTAVLEKQ